MSAAFAVQCSVRGSRTCSEGPGSMAPPQPAAAAAETACIADSSHSCQRTPIATRWRLCSGRSPSNLEHKTRLHPIIHSRLQLHLEQARVHALRLGGPSSGISSGGAQFQPSPDAYQCADFFQLYPITLSRRGSMRCALEGPSCAGAPTDVPNRRFDTAALVRRSIRHLGFNHLP